jgi:hypothetical protein
MWKAFNVTMRAVSSLLGLALLLNGIVWILQGLNLAFRVGFMVGDDLRGDRRSRRRSAGCLEQHATDQALKSRRCHRLELSGHEGYVKATVLSAPTLTLMERTESAIRPQPTTATRSM